MSYLVRTVLEICIAAVFVVYISVKVKGVEKKINAPRCEGGSVTAIHHRSVIIITATLPVILDIPGVLENIARLEGQEYFLCLPI